MYTYTKGWSILNEMSLIELKAVTQDNWVSRPHCLLYNLSQSAIKIEHGALGFVPWTSAG